MLLIGKISRAIPIALTLLFLCSCHQASGDEGNVLETKKGIHWQNKDGDVHLFLVQENESLTPGYRLFVITKTNLQVIYHTRLNSSVNKKMELTPVRVIGLDVYEYEIKHSFSRATCWMAIELRENGSRMAGMTRTFEGDINKIVPNRRFLRNYY